MTKTTILNAKIESVDVQYQGTLHVMLNLVLQGGLNVSPHADVVMGGSPFDGPDVKYSRHGEQPNLMADFVGGILVIAGTHHLSKCPGKVIRVELEEPLGPVLRIGHAMEDLWYDLTARTGLLLGRYDELYKKEEKEENPFHVKVISASVGVVLYRSPETEITTCDGVVCTHTVVMGSTVHHAYVRGYYNERDLFAIYGKDAVIIQNKPAVPLRK